MAIRSGRFVGDASAATGIEIINGNKAGTYRIFNSGNGTFEVDGFQTPKITLPAACSIDINPKGVVAIKASPSVDGIYDLLTDHGTVRNGRFALENSTNLQIVDTLVAGGFYRIMNSGEEVIRWQRGTESIIELNSKMTIDVELKKSDTLKVLPNATSGKGEGIYFHLDQLATVKSGRFKIDPKIPATTPADPSKAHKIIDTVGEEAYYRIFNSGAFDFKIIGLNAPATVKPNLSFDFKIDKKSVIEVQGLNADDPIEGIYEFIGDF